jgi:hypothetical protein
MCKLGPTCRCWMTREAEMLDERNATEVENGTPSFFLNSRDIKHNVFPIIEVIHAIVV